MTPESMPGLDRLALPAAAGTQIGGQTSAVRTAREQKPTEDNRRRVITWSDPLAVLAQASRLSGLEHLEALRDGRLPSPPIAALLRLELDEVEEGRAVFLADPGEDHYNPIGLVHGGLAAAMLDSALGCAVQSTLPRGATYSTIELKVNFLRPVTRDTGPLRQGDHGASLQAMQAVAGGDGRPRGGSVRGPRGDRSNDRRQRGKRGGSTPPASE